MSDQNLVHAMIQVFRGLLEYDITQSDRPYRGFEVLFNDYSKKFELLRSIEACGVISG